MEDKIIHQYDSDCTVDPTSHCCTICGAYHGNPCPSCGGRAYHAADCPAFQDELIHILRQRENGICLACGRVLGPIQPHQTVGWCDKCGKTAVRPLAMLLRRETECTA